MDRKPGSLTQPYEDAVANLKWIKIAGAGNAQVGKTCLLRHYCDSKFHAGYQATVGVDYGFKIHQLPGININVHLWDLSGKSEYADVRNELYTGTDGIFLVFDVTDVSSFEAMNQWLNEINTYTKTQPEIFIVGNKTDLRSKRTVTSDDGKTFADKHKYRYFETSAATGEGIDRMFDALLSAAFNKQR